MSDVVSEVSEISEALEDMVRTELTRQATAPQPDPDRMLHRVARTRRRTTVTATAAVMVLVIVVGAGVWIGPPNTPTAAIPIPLPPGARPGDTPAVWFTDPDHGYALADTCPNPCDVWLAYTTDGGHSWHGHKIPGQPRDVRMRVFGDTTIVLDAPGAQGGTRWLSTDSGRTWTTLPVEPTDTIDHIPDGALATVHTPVEAPQVLVLTPDGRSHRLATPPAVALHSRADDIWFAADGSAWIRGNTTLVSRDSGRTWQQVPLPTGAWQNFATDDGVHLYHTDGTNIWRKTGQADWVKLTPPPAVDDLHAQPDGGVLTTTGGQAYYAGPDDTAFQPTRRLDLARSFTGARRLRPTGDGWEHTADGHTWTRLSF